MKTIEGQIGRDHYSMQLKTESGNTIIADEPVSDGGTNAGFSPDELLAASLGACTCITVRMYADRKEWPLEKISVKVSVDINTENNDSNFQRDITLHGELSEKQISRLLTIANKCPIHKALTNPIHINTKLT